MQCRNQWNPGVPQDVVDHVCHVIVDGGPVGQAADPLVVFGEDRELQGQ